MSFIAEVGAKPKGSSWSTFRFIAMLLLPAVMALLGACAEETDIGSENKADQYFTVTGTAGPGGSISPQTQQVKLNERGNLTVTPAVGFVINSVSGCDVIPGQNNVYTTGPITANCTVSASFQLTHTVTATAGPGGTISPGTVDVADGNTATFQVTPNAGFSIASVSGCNGTLGQNGVYTTGVITANCFVNANFQQNTPTTYVVSTSAGPGGTIAPTSRVVNDGTTTTFTVTPDVNFAIQSVTGCQGSLDANTYTTGPITGDCTVVASFIPATVSYTVTAVVAGGNGQISPASNTVNEGATAQFTLIPNTGYQVDTVSGCGNNGSLSGTTYTTGPITGDCQITASFTIIKLTVTAVVLGTGGTVAPASQLVDYNTRASVSVTPDAHYVVSSVSGCGAIGTWNGNVYTTRTIRNNCQLSIRFALEQFTVTTNAGTGGSISPANPRVTYGNTAVFTVTPNTGYDIASVTGCSGALQGNTYTTGVITAACTVNASFVIRTYTVTATAGSGGTISPSTATVNHGATAAFSVVPDANFDIGVVSGCGGTLSAATVTTPATFTTAAVTSDCNINASFVAQTQNNITITSSVSGSGGAISPATIDVASGGNATFSLQADANFRINSVTGCKGTLSNNNYTTANVSANCAIVATFVSDGGQPLATVNTIISAGGDASPNALRLTVGTKATFTITPDAGFQLASVSGSGNGCSGGLTGSTYLTQDISANCSLTINFTASAGAALLSAASLNSAIASPSASFTYYAQAGSGGSITPRIANVIEGDTIDYVVTPDAGFDIGTVSGCGVYFNGDVYTSAAASADYDGCTVSATFVPIN